jgi:hypothetical protein
MPKVTGVRKNVASYVKKALAEPEGELT